ncbi:hypothetical protein CHS0354_026989 [Potamilus streckersoni]|uniref:Uncharacterized protein n=1 Tax=Potamilus streckersoni TaxID=2493646 RepID=A0AAE0SCE7_9BIVA|nr:hypothetical protein CHS0354_026989 [Potamilus streckersoni]
MTRKPTPKIVETLQKTTYILTTNTQSDSAPSTQPVTTPSTVSDTPPFTLHDLLPSIQSDLQSCIQPDNPPSIHHLHTLIHPDRQAAINNCPPDPSPTSIAMIHLLEGVHQHPTRATRAQVSQA